MEPIVIGLMGKPMAGKGTFTTFLNSLLEPDRAVSLRRHTGESDEDLEDRIRASQSKVVVVEIHEPVDVELVRGFPQHIIVDIFASPKTRWRRSRIAQESPEFGIAAYIRFLKRENTEAEAKLDEYRNALRHTIILVANYGTKVDFYLHVKEEVFDIWVLPRLSV